MKIRFFIDILEVFADHFTVNFIGYCNIGPQKLVFLTWHDTGFIPAGYSTNFYTGRLLPEVQPITLSYTIFHEKGTPFVYLLMTNSTPYTYLV